MTRTIYKEKIPATDPRLKRHIHHDSKSREYAFDTSSIPTVITTEHLRHIPILDQGQVGSCTANAGVGTLGTAPHVTPTDNSIYPLDEEGALKLYSDEETLDGDGPYPPNDNGSSGLTVAKVLLAKKFISGYQHNFSLQNTLLALTQYPLLVGIPWYQDMFTPDADGRVHPAGALAGGHEIEAYKVDAEKGIVWFHNSWGSSWGINGDFYLTWADLGTLLGQNGDSTVLLPVSITPPKPVTHSRTLRLKTPFMKGDDVKALQALIGATQDGIFGTGTKALVETFQHSHGLRADGIVGPVTWKVIDSL